MYLGGLQVPFHFETPELEEIVGNVFLVFIPSHPLLELEGAFIICRRQPQLLDDILKRGRNKLPVGRSEPANPLSMTTSPASAHHRAARSPASAGAVFGADPGSQLA